MSDDQFKKMTELIGGLSAKIDTVEDRLSKRISAVENSLNAKIDTVNVRIDAVEGKIDAVEGGLSGQMLKLYQHMEERFDELDAKLDSKADKEQVDRIQATLDGMVGRLDTDDQERAAIVAEQRRHGKWIGQLAKHTRTKLVPEQ